MKNIFLVAIALCFGSMLTQAQTTFGLRITEVSNDGINYIVSLEMQMQGEDPGVFKLGSTALQFAFPQAILSNPVLESTTLESSFPYLVPSLTTPSLGQCSFNIELAVPGTGKEISGIPGWTEIGKVKFDIENSLVILPLEWSYNGGTTETVVYLDDESTQIFMGADMVSVDEMESGLINNFAVYPNPNNGEMIYMDLETVLPNQKLQVEILDAHGKKVYVENLFPEGNKLNKEIKFDSILSGGSYLINLTIDNKVISRKFIVE